MFEKIFRTERYSFRLLLASSVTPFFLFICVFHSLAAMAGSLAFQGAYAVSENQSTLTITVNRSGSTVGAASVTVISLDGTATAGTDFTAVSQILTWGAGDALNKTFTVAIKDDAVVEGAEVFYLRFTSPVGDGTGGDTAITLTDYEEGKFQFSSSTFSGVEENLQAVATISRVSGKDGPATVKINSSATGSPAASDVADYTDIDTTVSFADGETSKNVSIALKNDATAEFSEFFQLTLSTPVNATLGSIPVASVEITDTDSDFTSTLKLLNKTTKNVTQSELVDLTQNSLLDTKKKITDLVNEIPILTLTELEAKQDTDGLMTFDVEKDRVYLRPIAIQRSPPGSVPNINVRDDINSTFLTSQGWLLEATPALATKGLVVLQKELASIFLPDLVIENNGNITIQVDQGAPPFERDTSNNVVVNYRFYDRWNLRPSMISTITDSLTEGYSLIAHPFDSSEVVMSVVYNDGTSKRQQILSPAPINGPELILELKSNGISRCTLSPSAGCKVAVTNPKQQNNGIITFDIVSNNVASGKTQTLNVTLLADYKIRKTPNFSPSVVGFTETNDLNGDSFADYKMIYANGEEQYFLFVSGILK